MWVHVCGIRLEKLLVESEVCVVRTISKRISEWRVHWLEKLNMEIGAVLVSLESGEFEY